MKSVKSTSFSAYIDLKQNRFQNFNNTFALRVGFRTYHKFVLNKKHASVRNASIESGKLKRQINIGENIGFFKQ